jgi:signal transduction histidine kinase/pSer/pThr/pTyr-binding forkhead associated (FHA) protein
VIALKVIQGPDRDMNFEVTGDSAFIGRDPDTDIALNDMKISRQHALLEQIRGIWAIRDMGSANGTYVNGRKISKPMALKLGDQIRVGRSLLLFGGAQAASRLAALDPGRIRVDQGQLVDSAIMHALPSETAEMAFLEEQLDVEAPAAALGENLRTLYRLTSAISSIFDVDQLLARVMDLIFDVLPADRGFILMFDEKSGELRPRICRQTGTDQAAETVPVSHTIVDHVVHNAEGVISSNAMTDERFEAGKSVHDFAIRSAMCVPLRARENILGVIHVDSSVADHVYSLEQLRLLTAIGYETGLAVQNVDLYHAGVQAERLAAVGETVAFLSHHIKNLLQGLRGGADAVEMSLKRDNLPQVKGGWQILSRNLERVYQFMLNMLAYAGERQPNRKSTDLNAVCHDAVELARHQAAAHGATIAEHYAKGLPRVEIDPDGIHQAVLNILLNGVSAVAASKGRVSIATTLDAPAERVFIHVSDDGPGIARDQMDRLFNVFTSTKGHGGSGLGLAVARKVVKEHGGHVSVTSSPGKGATFLIRLPLRAG